MKYLFLASKIDEKGIRMSKIAERLIFLEELLKMKCLVKHSSHGNRLVLSN